MKISYLVLPDLERLQYFFEVTERSPSGLIWRNPPGKKLKPGDVAGGFNGRYWIVRINGKYYHCSRIIFYMNTGTDPLGFHVDHVFRNSNINKNLRLATSSQNNANRAKQKSIRGKPTTSQYKGVSWFKRDKKWKATICVNKKSIYLGMYENEKDAAIAYNKAAIDYFGEFACLNEFK